MNGKIEIIGQNVFQDLVKLNENLLIVLASIEKIATAGKGINLKNVSIPSQDSKEAQKNIQQLTTLEKELLKVEKQIEVQNAKLTDQYKAKARELKDLKIQQNQTSDSIRGVANQLNTLKQKYQDLSKAERENIKVGGQMLIQIKNLDKEHKRLNETMGQFQNSVGNYEKGFAKLNNILGAAGIGLGLAEVFNQIGKGITVLKEFESSMSRLSAVTGMSGSDLTFMGNAAIELSKNVGIAAKDIVENFTLIGSKMPELLKSKEGMLEVSNAAIVLSKAAGIDLPQATTTLLDIMNQWGATSKEAASYIDILSVAAREGAIEIPQLAEAIVRFGGVAKISGVNAKEAAAMVEVLGKSMRSSDPEKIGTGLRNLLTIMSAPSALSKDALTALRKYGVNLNFISDATVPLNQRLQEFSKISKDTNALAEVFGKENLEVGIKILGNVDALNLLLPKLDEHGAASKQAAVNTDNLAGSIAKLDKAWEAMILTTNKDGGVTSSLKDIIDMFTSLINKSGELGIIDMAFDAIKKSIFGILGYKDDFFKLVDKLKEGANTLLNWVGISTSSAQKQKEFTDAQIEGQKKLIQSDTDLITGKKKGLLDILNIDTTQINEFDRVVNEYKESQNKKVQVDFKTFREQAEIAKKAAKEKADLEKNAEKNEDDKRKENDKLRLDADAKIQSDMDNAQEKQTELFTKEQEQNTKKTEQEIANEKLIQETKWETLSQAGEALGIMAGMLEKNTLAYKALALAQVGIETGKAIASLTAVAEANPLNAVTFGSAGMLQWAAGLVRILANVASATSYIKGFYTGVEDFQGGMAYVGERGQEIVKTDNGLFLTPAQKTLTYLPEHTDVIDNTKTMQILNGIGSVNDLKSNKENQWINQLLESNKNLNKTIKNKKFMQINIDSKGFNVYQYEGNNVTRRHDKYFRGIN